MQAKNIPEFIALIKRYESITMEEIEATGDFKPDCWDFASTPSILTGYGRRDTCTLCRPINGDCRYCVYKFPMACCSRKMGNTYDNIGEANSPLKLFSAFRARAVAMREYAKSIGIDDEMINLVEQSQRS